MCRTRHDSCKNWNPLRLFWSFLPLLSAAGHFPLKTIEEEEGGGGGGGGEGGGEGGDTTSEKK